MKSPETIEFFYLKGEQPFICAVHGPCTVEILAQIEKDVCETMTEMPEWFSRGDGTYTCTVNWIPPQIGDEGRVEIPGYWDVQFQSFEPIPGDC